MSTVALSLGEATINLYPEAANGEALTDQAVWMGACVENLRLAGTFEGVLIAPTGVLYRKKKITDESHQIQIGRLWVLPTANLLDYQPIRNQRFVLEIVWQHDGNDIWHKRTYYGVTPENYNLASMDLDGTAGQFGAEQEFRAERFTPASNYGVYPIPPVSASAYQNVLFTHDGPILTGDYFLGSYKWPGAVTITEAKVISRAAQTTPTILTLEVGGVLTANTLTIPTGAVNAEVSASSTFNAAVSPEQTVRWQATSGPAAVEDCPWVAAIVMRIRN